MRRSSRRASSGIARRIKRWCLSSYWLRVDYWSGRRSGHGCRGGGIVVRHGRVMPLSPTLKTEGDDDVISGRTAQEAWVEVLRYPSMAGLTELRHVPYQQHCGTPVRPKVAGRFTKPEVMKAPLHRRCQARDRRESICRKGKFWEVRSPADRRRTSGHASP